MAVFINDAIYLGNFADADTVEGTGSLVHENPGIYQQNFGSAANPLYARVVDMAFDDANNDGAIFRNNYASAENISYNLGAGPVTTKIDSVDRVSMTVTYVNGTTLALTNVVMFQDALGNLFIQNSTAASDGVNGPSNLLIRSINVTSVQNGSYAGINAFSSLEHIAGPVDGTPGNDNMVSPYTDANQDTISNGPDVIYGYAGNDTIAGGGGDDTLYGGDGNDFLRPGAGNDSVYGGAGNDTLELSSNDFLDGGVGTDTLDATFGAFPEIIVFTGDYAGTVDNGTSFANIEVIFDSAGADSINASASNGNLWLSTGADGDTITGGGGNDTIDGGSGNDTLSGGAGNDTVLGGTGNDTLGAGAGNDTLTGGTGNDTLTGGAGDDIFVYAPGDGADRITDFNTGNSGTLRDGNPNNNDFINLSAYYDHISELHADQADDGILNQSNDGVGGVSYANNTSFAGGSLTFTGASADGNSFTVENTGVVCFVAGTLIKTIRGEVAVEDLVQGDLVQTMDSGLQPIRWIGRRSVSRAAMRRNDKLRPIRLTGAAFGIAGMSSDLVVSQQHRILLVSKVAMRMFGTKEVLIPAKKLLSIGGVTAAEDMNGIDYFHILFDRHEIVFANGAPAESLYLGRETLHSLTPDGRAEIATLFPQTADPDFAAGLCRPLISGKTAMNMAARMSRNQKVLVEQPLAQVP